MISQEELFKLSRYLVTNFDSLLKTFNIAMQHNSDRYYGPCPIHNGDRTNSFNLFHKGNVVVGNWTCYSNMCQDKFVNTPIGFIRGMLSNRKYNWTNTGKKASFAEALEWAIKFANNEHLSVQISKAEENSTGPDFLSIPVESIKSLKRPSRYFAGRGYNRDILDRHNVGECYQKGKKMYLRAVVPVYNNDCTAILGCTGRSIFEECSRCGYYHHINAKCPHENVRWYFTKWRHSPKFPREHSLYNYWFAKEEIERMGYAIITESPGNVWNLEMKGYYNAVGTYGTYISRAQVEILDNTGILSILAIADNDNGGDIFLEQIQERFSNYNVIAVKPDFDIGNPAVSSSAIHELVGCRLDELVRYNNYLGVIGG